MTPARFRDDQVLGLPPLVAARQGDCACHGRRWFTGALVASALPGAWARDGVDVGKNSRWAQFVPPEEVEGAAGQQYAQLKQEAAGKNALAPDSHPQAQRLHYIAQRIIPYTYEWNPRARDWKWEVSLLGSPQLNAFCMPGGKIAFFSAILVKLQLSDDEVAMIMGHEMAHALREHARERMGKSLATQAGAGVLSSLLGLGNAGNMALNVGAQLASLKWSRGDESEADLVGLDLAGRAGYDPRAGVSLWQKMMKANGGAPPQWLSTHPAGNTRIADIQSNLPKVMPLYQAAAKPERRWDAASLKNS